MDIFGNKKLLIVFTVSLILCILIITVLLSLPHQSPNNNTAAITPTPVVIDITSPVSNSTPSPVPTVYTVGNDPTNQYSLEYPQTFTKITNSNPQDTSLTLTFSDSNKTYHFLVSRPGQINPETDTKAQVQQTDVTYGKEDFTRKIWLENGTPIYIVAIPKDLSAAPYVFSMEIPPTNSSMYLQTFADIVSSFSQ